MTAEVRKALGVVAKGTTVRPQREEEHAGQRLLPPGKLAILRTVWSREVRVDPRSLWVIHMSQRANATKQRGLVGTSVRHGQTRFTFDCRPGPVTPVDVSQFSTGLAQV